MHIPDGYLSPETCAVMYAATAPFWYRASKRIKQTLRGRAAPLLAMFAALTFTIQMFNIPVPPATSTHAVGGTLFAIVLGPWAAVIGLSVALTIQALFFGDGGITALGANAFNLAVALPLTGYAVYSLLSHGAAPASRRRIVAAAAGAYVGINVAGILVALELGIQPIFWTVDGQALYNPYGLRATLPAMALAHLTVAGFAEAAVTGLALVYLVRTHPALLAAASDSARFSAKLQWSLVALLAFLILLVPIGLLAPGQAFMEWGAEELAGLVGYAPSGLADMTGLWSAAPFAGYQPPGGDGSAGFFSLAAGYVLSAVVGAALILMLAMVVRIALRHVRPPAEEG